MLQNVLSVAFLTTVGGSASLAAAEPDIGAEMNPAAVGRPAEPADLNLETLDD